jgi:hypothetical protein
MDDLEPWEAEEMYVDSLSEGEKEEYFFGKYGCRGGCGNCSYCLML